MTQKQPELIVREYQPGDEESILDGFNRAFARVDPNFQPRSREMWNWVYRENPAGLRIWLGLTPDGDVVNQQAGIPVRVQQDGRSVLWTQIVDSFTDPDLTGGLKKPGLFIKAATPFWQNYGGPNPNQDAYHYGVPVRSAFRIGQRFLGYGACRSQNKLRLTFDQYRAPSSTSLNVEEIERFTKEVDELFDEVATGRGAILVRDQAHLNWRYVTCPDRSYRIAVTRDDSGRLRGYAILGRGVFDGECCTYLCDWLVPPEDDRASAALFDWAIQAARADGEDSLLAVLADTSPEWLLYQRAGFRIEPTDYYMVARSYRPPYDLRWLYQNWHYTLGDFDLC